MIHLQLPFSNMENPDEELIAAGDDFLVLTHECHDAGSSFFFAAKFDQNFLLGFNDAVKRRISARDRRLMQFHTQMFISIREWGEINQVKDKQKRKLSKMFSSVKNSSLNSSPSLVEVYPDKQKVAWRPLYRFVSCDFPSLAASSHAAVCPSPSLILVIVHLHSDAIDCVYVKNNRLIIFVLVFITV